MTSRLYRAVLAVCLVGWPGFGASLDYHLAARFDWTARRGFYFQLENRTPGEAACGLDTMKLVLGVADGENWRFVVHQPAWVLDRDYVARAVIGPDRSELWLDGVPLGDIPAGYAPLPGEVNVARVVDWARGPAAYLPFASRVELAASDGSQAKLEPPTPADLRLLLFEPTPGERYEWTADPKVTTTITATFRLRAYPDLHALAPFIDRWGQCIGADFATKVRSDDDLRDDIAREAALLADLPASAAFDVYGGYREAGWSEPGTGFFRVVRRDGWWWLLSPEGNPCFYVGLSAMPATTWERTPVTGREFLFEWLPPKEGVWRACWATNDWGVTDGTESACLHAANLIRKYGEAEWSRRATEQAVRRCRAFGFSGGGKWGAPELLVATPVLGHWAVPALVRHPDVFDPVVRERFRAELERQIAPRRDDPLVLGWSLGNEYDEIITRDETRRVLALGAAVPARRALVEYAVGARYGGDVAATAKAWGSDATDLAGLLAAEIRPPDEDLEAMRCEYARRYYQFIYETVKTIDPNHLYLGFWPTIGWWESDEDWRSLAPYCDVIGYDRYAFDFADERFLSLMRETDKPILCGEFSFPPYYGGQRGYGRYGAAWADDEAAAGELYARWVEAASTNPWCVGVQWFMYRDQDLTGRGPGQGPQLVFGEHYAFGLITVTDRVKWDLGRRMREANLTAAARRLAAMVR